MGYQGTTLLWPISILIGSGFSLGNLDSTKAFKHFLRQTNIFAVITCAISNYLKSSVIPNAVKLAGVFISPRAGVRDLVRSQ